MSVGRDAAVIDKGTTSDRPTGERAFRAALFAGVGAIPGLASIAVTALIEGEAQLLVGVAGIALTGVGLAVGASWGWVGRPPASAWRTAMAVLLVGILIFGGTPGRVLALATIVTLIGARMRGLR